MCPFTWPVSGPWNHQQLASAIYINEFFLASDWSGNVELSPLGNLFRQSHDPCWPNQTEFKCFTLCFAGEDLFSLGSNRTHTLVITPKGHLEKLGEGDGGMAGQERHRSLLSCCSATTEPTRLGLRFVNTACASWTPIPVTETEIDKAGIEVSGPEGSGDPQDCFRVQGHVCLSIRPS